MSLDLVGLPCEIRFKIFDHLSVADLTKWLKIQKLRDSILAFLEDEAFKARRSAKYFPLRNKIRKLDYSLLDNPQDGIERQMPHLRSWSLRQPVAWLLSSIDILTKANSLQFENSTSEISSHTPMHNPKINSNFIFYIRNSKVALWRRETQSGTFLEPHINVDNHSWVCKTDLELITSEEVFATGIANSQNGQPDGTVEIKVHSTITLETLHVWQSDFLTKNPSVDLISINKFQTSDGQSYITLLISIWDRRWSNTNVEEDIKYVSYYVLDSQSNHFNKIETLTHSEFVKHKVYLHHTRYYKVTLNRLSDAFSTKLSISCSSSDIFQNQKNVIFEKFLFANPIDFGLHCKLNLLWIRDRLQFTCYNLATQKVVCKIDLRCKTKVSVSDCDDSINISMFNQLNNSTQLFKIQSESGGGDFNVAEVSFENMVDYDQIIFHDSAVLLHSDDKCSIRIHDFLHPFLL